MNLKDFKPDKPDFDPDFKPDHSTDYDSGNQISGSGYHEEINTIKIDKLSNKVTIISIIIPVMIGAILIFAYLDMKSRVVDADKTKQNQFDLALKQFEEKLNALDVKIAQTLFDLGNTLPDLNKKMVAIEGQIAKISSTKADNKAMASQFAKLQKLTKKNQDQDKSTIAIIEQMNKKTLSTMQSNQKKFNKDAEQIKEEFILFKEEFDARLLELSDYEQQIGLLRKDLSLQEKRYKQFEQDSMDKVQIQTQLNEQKTSFEQQINELKALIGVPKEEPISNPDQSLKQTDDHSPQTTLPGAQSQPAPQVNIDPAPSGGISKQPLTQ